MTLPFIFSQIFVIINYSLVAATYLVKKRKVLLLLSFLSLIASGISYLLLSAWSGLAMAGLAIVRNIIFMIQNKKDNTTKITKADWWVLAFLVVASIVISVFTYNGVLSLFSVFATMLYTISIWQKNIMAYNVMGLLVSVLWIIYDIFVFSPLAVICESVLFVVMTISLIVKIVKNKKSAKLEAEELENPSNENISTENN